MKSEGLWVVCIDNDDYLASLERGKLYRRIQDSTVEADGLIHVIDESGEDYLYDAAWFKAISLPESVRVRLSNSGGAGRRRRLSSQILSRNRRV